MGGTGKSTGKAGPGPSGILSRLFGGSARPDPAPAAPVTASSGPAATLRVFGMKRAGNHAVIDWLIRNSGAARYHFLNNCKPNKTPFESALRFYTEAGSTRRGEAPFDRGDTAPDLFMASYEDLNLEDLLGEDAAARRLVWPHDAPRDVYVQRNFLNWLPSYLRLWRNRGVDAPSALCAKVFPAIETWKANHRLHDSGAAKIVVVEFEHWRSDPAYRRDLLAALGFAPRDDDISRVPRNGGGSSFDGLDFDGKAQEMAVGERWRTILDDPLCRGILQLAVSDAALRGTIRAQMPAAYDEIMAH